jgi:hypothetical protein
MNYPLFGSDLPWRRFWCRRDGSGPISVDFSNAFLSDLVDDSIWRGDTDLRCTAELLPTVGPIVLSGEPGMGKSTELKTAIALSEGQPGIVISANCASISEYADFRRHVFKSDPWERWLANPAKTMTLFVDSIDEGLIQVPTFVELLTADLGKVSRQRLRLVLVCRSMEWPTTVENSLFNLWELPREKAPVMELCPLRQTDVRIAANALGLDSDAFLHAVYEAQAAPLAARPVTLSFLLKEFREGHRTAWSHRELYERGSHRLVREHDAARASRFQRRRKVICTSDDDARYRTAQRLAALLLLTGRTAFNTSHLHPEDVPANDISVTIDDELAAVETALFTGFGADRFRFVHQTIAECLAAQSLKDRPLVQLRKLLCSWGNGLEHVAPQLAELSAWVAGYNQEFFHHLLRIDPAVLLRSDVARVQADCKRSLIDALLEGAQREEIFDEHHYRRFYKGLKHPDLTNQLRPILIDRSAGIIVRRLAFEIAEVCELQELCDDFIALLHNNEEQQYIREAASGALCKSLPSERLAELIPLARGQVGADPDASIRGDALRRLVPEYWSVREALPAIHEPQESNLIGSYRVFLSSELSNHISNEDVLPLLAKIAEWSDCFDAISELHAVAAKAFTLAMERLHESEIASAMVNIWLQKSRGHHPFINRNNQSPTRNALSNTSHRRTLAALILNDTRVETSDLWCITGSGWGVLYREDLTWILEHILNASSDRQFAWVEAFKHLASSEVFTTSWDKFLEVRNQVEEIQRFYPLSWEINSPESRKMKADYLRREREDKRWKQRTNEKLDPKVRLAQDMQLYVEGKTWVWMRVIQDLAIATGETKSNHSHRAKVEELPGWRNASDAERLQYREIARSFLLHQNDGYATKGALTNYADGGVLAIQLFQKDIDKDPELKHAICENWIETLTGWYSSDHSVTQELFCFAYYLNPQKSLSGLVRELQSNQDGYGHLFAMNRVSQCWNDKIATIVSDFIKNSNNPETIKSGLAQLADIDLEASEKCARSIIERYDSCNPMEAFDCVIAALATALAKVMPSLWEESFLMIKTTDGQFAKKVLLEMVDIVDPRSWSALAARSEEELTNVYLSTEHLFPPEERSSFESGIVTRKHLISDLRNSILSALQARASHEACSQFLRLIQELPENATWLRWQYQQTLLARRRTEWSPNSLQEVQALLENQNRRLIHNESDLQDLVLEALNRIQDHLTRQSLPAVENLWNNDGAGNKRKNFRPKDEENLSDYIARELQRELDPSSRIVVNREVQPRRGKRTDILVQATRDGARAIDLVIEVKGCWNSGIKTSVKAQLVDEYLVPFNRTHGIFLVGWFWCDKWTGTSPRKETPLASRAVADAVQEVAILCTSYDGITQPQKVVGYVLDATLPP